MVSIRRRASQLLEDHQSEKLEFIHKDVCEPALVKSLSGVLYYVALIDDSSRKV